MALIISKFLFLVLDLGICLICCNIALANVSTDCALPVLISNLISFRSKNDFRFLWAILVIKFECSGVISSGNLNLYCNIDRQRQQYANSTRFHELQSWSYEGISKMSHRWLSSCLNRSRKELVFPERFVQI